MGRQAAWEASGTHATEPGQHSRCTDKLGACSAGSGGYTRDSQRCMAAAVKLQGHHAPSWKRANLPLAPESRVGRESLEGREGKDPRPDEPAVFRRAAKEPRLCRADLSRL